MAQLTAYEQFQVGDEVDIQYENGIWDMITVVSKDDARKQLMVIFASSGNLSPFIPDTATASGVNCWLKYRKESPEPSGATGAAGSAGTTGGSKFPWLWVGIGTVAAIVIGSILFGKKRRK